MTISQHLTVLHLVHKYPLSANACITFPCQLLPTLLWAQGNRTILPLHPSPFQGHKHTCFSMFPENPEKQKKCLKQTSSLDKTLEHGTPPLPNVYWPVKCYDEIGAHINLSLDYIHNTKINFLSCKTCWWWYTCKSNFRKGLRWKRRRDLCSCNEFKLALEHLHAMGKEETP